MPIDQLPQTPPAYEQGLAVGQAFAKSSSAARTTAEQTGEFKTPAWLQPTSPAQVGATLPDLRQVMQDTVNGAPVLPPGMTTRQASMYISHDWMSKHIDQSKTLVFVSMSESDAGISAVLGNLYAHASLRNNAVVLIRGWAGDKTGLPLLVGKLASLQPSSNEQVNVAVDPIWFEDMHITRVPAVAHMDAGGQWRVIYGDGLLPSEAVTRLSAGLDIGKTFGNIYPIIEPDVIQVIKDRTTTYNWKQGAADAQSHYFQKMPSIAPALPESLRGLNYTKDPSIIVSHDISLPDGRVVAHAGQVLNPLANTAVPWSTWRAIVFNAGVPWEVAQAQAWARTYPSARLMMVNPPDKENGYTSLEESMGRPVYVASPMVTGKLGITNTPALVWPADNLLHIYVKPVPVDPTYPGK